MKTLFHIFVYGTWLVGLSACHTETKKENPPILELPIEGQTVTLSPLYSLFRIQTDNSNRLYVLDREDSNIKVFDREGTFLHQIGQKGEGPGEFSYLSSFSIGKDRSLAVVAGGNRVSLFREDGSYSHSVFPLGISMMNGNINFIEDSLLLISGFQHVDNEKTLYDGLYAHVYGIDSKTERHFMPVSQKTLQHKFTFGLSSECKVNTQQEAWCIDVSDYVLRKFDSQGTALDSLRFNPSYYRPMEKKQPSEGINSKIKWMLEWDQVSEIYILSEDYMGVLVNQSINDEPLRYFDVISLKTRKIVQTYNFSSWQLGWIFEGINPNTQELIFQEKPNNQNQDPAIKLRFVSYASMLTE